MKTSMNLSPWSSCRFRAMSRSSRYGDTRLTMVMVPASFIRQASSPTRRTDSARSEALKPRSCFSGLVCLFVVERERGSVSQSVGGSVVYIQSIQGERACLLCSPG